MNLVKRFLTGVIGRWSQKDLDDEASVVSHGPVSFTAAMNAGRTNVLLITVASAQSARLGQYGIWQVL
jgi:hypothetical protein